MTNTKIINESLLPASPPLQSWKEIFFAYSAPPPISFPPTSLLPLEKLLVPPNLFPHFGKAEQAERDQTRGEEVIGKGGKKLTLRTLGLGSRVLGGREGVRSSSTASGVRDKTEQSRLRILRSCGGRKDNQVLASSYTTPPGWGWGEVTGTITW